MMNSPFVAFLIFTGLLLTLPAAADEAKSFTLKVSRPPHPGDKSLEHFKMTSEEARKVIMDGKKLKGEAEDVRGEATGILEVLEVSPHGHAQKIKFTVEKFKCQKDVEAEAEPFKAGTVIAGNLGGDGKETFTVDGGEIDATAAKVLKAVLELTKDSETDVTDDIIFRTSQPHAAGSEWEMDKAAIIKSFSKDMPFKLAEKEVSATVKFAAVKMIEGTECAVLRPQAIMKPTVFKGMPEGFKARTAHFKLGGEVTIPLDEKLISPSEKSTLDMSLNGTFDSPNGMVEMEVFSRMERERESKPVK